MSSQEVIYNVQEDQDKVDKEVFGHISEIEGSKDNKVDIQRKEVEIVVVSVNEVGTKDDVDLRDFENVKMVESFKRRILYKHG